MHTDFMIWLVMYWNGLQVIMIMVSINISGVGRGTLLQNMIVHLFIVSKLNQSFAATISAFAVTSNNRPFALLRARLFSEF
ncbi:MAG: hypothetical protein HY578_04075 [Nitrospinae bacterium]|nr:hypothetical protein [Nitrospinota bacterium]